MSPRLMASAQQSVRLAAIKYRWHIGDDRVEVAVADAHNARPGYSTHEAADAWLLFTSREAVCMTTKGPLK